MHLNVDWQSDQVVEKFMRETGHLGKPPMFVLKVAKIQIRQAAHTHTHILIRVAYFLKLSLKSGSC